VAVGELADGLDIDLNKVPRKYDGLDGTELAISESQERMAVVVAPEDVEAFCALADGENLEASVIAVVKADPRLTMTWNGRTIVDVSRAFLDTNGAPKHITVHPSAPKAWSKPVPQSFSAGYEVLAGDLNVCSRRGLSERFDSTIGAGTVLMPFGGKYQQTPIQAMVHTVSVEKGHTDTCSVMSWGYNPAIAENSPYHSAYLAVVESVSKLIAAGASFEDVYLSFQEYFAKPGQDPDLWGDPFAALLGAFKAQMDLGVAAIGGKDSMSGTFENLTVPPTLVSFAITTGKAGQIVSNEFKKAGSTVMLFRPDYDKEGLPKADSLKALYAQVHELTASGKALAVYTPTYGGVAEAILKMCIGNGLGFAYADGVSLEDIFGYAYGSFVVELAHGVPAHGTVLGVTTAEAVITCGGEELSLAQLQRVYEDKLESVYPCNIPSEGKDIPAFSYEAENRPAAIVGAAKPKVLIPVFPGTNCEYDTAKAMADAGAEPEVIIIANRTASHIAASTERFAQALKTAQMVFIPGGFSGGDEPDGSGKFITAFFRNAAVKAGVEDMLDARGGLMAGVCNGFQALIKLGLVPYGKIIDTDENCPTLTFNTIGRHQSRLVRTRIASNKSPWLAATQVGDVYTVPISHGEGRFLASEALVKQLAENGQIATQYVDLAGKPTDDVRFNPNNSVCAIEGITSPDGRVFGKMGHSERIGANLYKNVEGVYDMKMFESAVRFFHKN
jgi:phosphoribosylformylglycinamidine synthase